MRIQTDDTRILTPEEQEQEFEKWFQCKKDNYEVWGNGDDFWVDDEIKRFCKLGYEQGLSVLKAVADKAYCEKANAEIQLDKAKELVRAWQKYANTFYFDRECHARDLESLLERTEILLNSEGAKP